jgi:protein-S-isoprenylcysteine O-methyltransferase Ste14
VRQASLTVIGACWLAWLCLWFVLAFSTKRTLERSGRWWPSASVVAVFALVLADRTGHDAFHRVLWAPSALIGVVSVALVVAGLACTAWARLTLGRNWSGSVVFKQGHELIVTGPYALVRHPIYTGLVAMMLGTALAYAQPLGLALFAAGVVVLSMKARNEERLMTSHFPDAYPSYRRRVKALIPFVL